MKNMNVEQLRPEEQKKMKDEGQRQLRESRGECRGVKVGVCDVESG
jgi:hypothetical protein